MLGGWHHPDEGRRLPGHRLRSGRDLVRDARGWPTGDRTSALLHAKRLEVFTERDPKLPVALAPRT